MCVHRHGNTCECVCTSAPEFSGTCVHERDEGQGEGWDRRLKIQCGGKHNTVCFQYSTELKNRTSLKHCYVNKFEMLIG
jgi:hypothetical protein